MAQEVLWKLDLDTMEVFAHTADRQPHLRLEVASSRVDGKVTESESLKADHRSPCEVKYHLAKRKRVLGRKHYLDEHKESNRGW